MSTPDWPTVIASIGTVIVGIAGKIGWDAKRGNSSGVQKELEAHMKDDTDKFGAMTQALKEVVTTATTSKVELVREIGGVAQSVARIEGQLGVIVQALKKD